MNTATDPSHDKHITLFMMILIQEKQIWELAFTAETRIFSAANLALAGFPLTNALCENLLSRY